MPNEERPNPDELLKQVLEQERIESRGKLKIFFGACAGVGKTYAMLNAAHELLRDGVDVVVGLVETHNREDTLRLVDGLPMIPPREIDHRGVVLKEFDIDAALARKPAILLIDELAHTNAPGSRHPKRWHDVEELLEEGISIYTTLNVQHLESLNDVVAGITGIWVKETVPDAIFDKADDIALVDIPSDELLKRLSEGKVYIAPQAKKRAAQNFFRKSNLIALRELALRRTAERVDAQMNLYKTQFGGKGTGLAIADKIMVCIGPDPLSAKLVRSAKRMANALKAQWVAVYVENYRHYRLDKKGQEAVERNLRLAEQMGAKSEILQGDNAIDTIIDYATANGITKIIAGKPTRPRWKELLLGSLVDKLVRRSGTIDIYVITGEAGQSTIPSEKKSASQINFLSYLYCFLIIGACTLIALPLGSVLESETLLMIYLAGVIAAASRFGLGPSIFSSLLAISAANFFFIKPFETYEMGDSQHILTIIVMLLTGIVISTQASRLRLQAVFSRKRERNTSALYNMTRELAANRGYETLATVATRHVSEVFESHVSLWLPDSFGLLVNVAEMSDTQSADIKEESAARWAYEHRQPAGMGTSTQPSAKGFYVPLMAGGSAIGAMGVIPRLSSTQLSNEQMTLLETFASQTASSLERAKAADTAERSRVEAEGEKLRNILLSSVSHDLRTPLASITGSASSLLLDGDKFAEASRKELLRSIHEEAVRLAKIVTNLLDVTSLEAGTVKLNKQLYFIEELIGSALMRTEERLENRIIKTDIANGLPMVNIDGLLIEQVLVNLLENAAKFTPADKPVTISAEIKDDGEIYISVADKGLGIPVEDQKEIFEKFYSARKKRSGLGLAICRGIVQAHGGRIWVENQEDGGAVFTFTLPLGNTKALS